MYKKPHARYKQIQLNTPDTGRLLLMMYEGAVKFLRKSRRGIEEKDVMTFCCYLNKAQDIITELMNALDFERGGNIAADLHSLYDFMLHHLTEANLKMDAEKIEDVIDLLNSLYEAYSTVILKKEKPQEVRIPLPEECNDIRISL